MYPRTCKKFGPANQKFTSYKSASHKKDWVRKSAKCHICGRSANLTNYLRPQIAICRTYYICGPSTFTPIEDLHLLSVVCCLPELGRSPVLGDKFTTADTRERANL